eukprot:8349956-Pyramimonas_sp.AAC.1
MESATDRSAQWLQSSRAYMPYRRDLRSRSQRRTENQVSMCSGSSGISEREMLHAVLMVNTDGQMSMRAEENTFIHLPTVSTSHPYTYDEYPTARISENNPITEEEARGYMNAFTPLSRND